MLYLTTSAKLDALGHRWLAELSSSYKFEIFYKPGVSHKDADSLSRKPDPEQKSGSKHISAEVFRELCKLVSSPDFDGVAECSNVMPAVSNAIHVANHTYSPDWTREQLKDSSLKRVIDLVSRGVKLRDRQRRREAPEVMRLLSLWKRLVIVDKRLYLKSTDQTGNNFHRLVIPPHLQDTVFHMIHDDMGHLGRDKTLSLAQERFFWVGLTKFVETKIKSCYRCQCAKAPSLPERAPLVSIVTSRPLELVCIDFLSLEESRGKFTSILVITDHYTGYAQAYPTRNQKATTVAKILVDDFVKHYGLMQRLHSDQGGCFESHVIRHMCKSLGIKKSHTTPYHAMGDGKTERFNRTLLSMLRTMEPAQKASWKDHVSSMVHAYNCCRHASTGVTPYYLMFGRCPRIAVDIFLGITDNNNINTTARDIRSRLEHAYNAASKAANAARAAQTRGYNKKVRGIPLTVGDYVLVKNVHFEGKHKLVDKWNSDLNIVTEQPNEDIPVFRVRAEKDGKEKILHRNLLLPVVLPWPEDRDNDDIDDVHNDDFNDDSDNDVEDSVSDIEVHLDYNPLPIPQVVEISQTDVQTENIDNVVPEFNAYIDVTDNFERDVPSTQSPVRLPAPLSPPMATPLAVPSSSPDPPVVRRSGRSNIGHIPVRLGEYVSHAQTVENIQLNWQVKVAALLQLLPLFPLNHYDICHALIYVISHG